RRRMTPRAVALARLAPSDVLSAGHTEGLMVFSSTIFLVGFLPFVLAAYFLAPHRLRNAFLIFASLFFYAWGEREFAWVLPLSIVGNYLAGVWIARALTPGPSPAKPGEGKKAMRVLAAAVA